MECQSHQSPDGVSRASIVTRSMSSLSLPFTHELLERAAEVRVLVIGDVMLDQFIWGHVGRISPEAPVPVVEFDRESFMPGGAANVARNLTSLKASAELLGLVGRDDWGRKLKALLGHEHVQCEGILAH